MADSETGSSEKTKSEQDLLLEEYKGLIPQIVHWDSHFWNKSKFFLTFESAFLAGAIVAMRDFATDSKPLPNALMLALLAAGERTGPLQWGAGWLAESQRPDGSWEEPWFTGTGFPRDFYLNYHMYRHRFPMMALAMDRSPEAVQGGISAGSQQLTVS